MQETQQQREARADAWKRSLAAQLAAKHDREDREMRRNLWIAVALFICGSVIAGGCLVRRSVDAGGIGRPGDVGGPPTVWATDAAPEQLDAGAVPGLGRPMPEGPIKGQKRPDDRGRCADDETTINGACWMELVRKPGTDKCGAKGFEHNGRCYVPVQQAQRPPTSVEP